LRNGFFYANKGPWTKSIEIDRRKRKGERPRKRLWQEDSDGNRDSPERKKHRNCLLCGRRRSHNPGNV